MDAARVYLDCSTQWRHGFNGPTGIDYTAAATVMELRGVADRDDCLTRLQEAEQEALAILRERRGND